MNELAKAWLAALRSGEYEQTSNNLHDDYGYCCLGVAAEVAGCEWEKDHLSEAYHIKGSVGAQTALMPHVMWLKFGLDGIIPQDTCALWNDEDDMSFVEIADEIEKIANE